MELLKRNGHGLIRKHSLPSVYFNTRFQVLQHLIQLWKQWAMAQTVKVFQAFTIQLIVGCRLLDCIAYKKIAAPSAPKREKASILITKT